MRRRRPGILVIHRRDIAATTWILVLVPRPPDRGILVVADQVQIQAAVIHIVGEIDGTCTAADDHNADLPREATGLFHYLVVCVGMHLADPDRTHVEAAFEQLLSGCIFQRSGLLFYLSRRCN